MQFRPILACNLLGLAIFTSWWLPLLSHWAPLNDAVFWFFNRYIDPSHPWIVELLALTNARRFDTFIFCTMLAVFFLAMKRDSASDAGYLKWGALGLVMLASAGIISSIIHGLMTYGHPSPAYTHPGANLITELTDYNVKDAVSNSFPGDHGVHAMIFAFFLLRFGDRLTAALGVLLALLVTGPRIMVGAHAVSDVYVGSLCLVLLLIPWVIYSPLPRLSQRGINLLADHLRR